MRKLIVISILSAQNIDIFFLSVIALNALLISLPEECKFSNPHKTDIIAKIIDKVTDNIKNETNLHINPRLLRQLFNILGLTVEYF